MGLQTGQLLVFVFKLAPCLFLWLVPLGDPAVAAKEIDRELNSESTDMPAGNSHPDGADKQAATERASTKNKRGGVSNMAVIWVFVLVAMLPPFRTSLPLSHSGSFEIMALPPLLLIIIPLYQMVIQPMMPSSGGKAKGAAKVTGLSEGLTSDAAANPVADTEKITPL
jgi:hypothetical protein